jgi:hypothetical protein
MGITTISLICLSSFLLLCTLFFYSTLFRVDSNRRRLNSLRLYFILFLIFSVITIVESKIDYDKVSVKETCLKLEYVRVIKSHHGSKYYDWELTCREEGFLIKVGWEWKVLVQEEK